MNAALQALAAVDFHWTRGLRDVWAEPAYHVDDLNGDVVDRIVAEFFARTRAPDSNPIGHILSGRAGAGKTHLIGTLRRRVWENRGWFVLVDIVGVVDFWRTAALGFLESLSRRMPGGQTQSSAVLSRALQRLSADHGARAAAAGRVRPGITKTSAVEILVTMLGAVEPAETRKHQDVVRALALLDARDIEVSTFAAMWLQGHEGEEDRRRLLGFLEPPPPPAEIVRGLLWIMGFSGPILIAVDQIDSIVSEANALAAEPGAGARRATSILQTIAGGLMDLHDLKRRAMTLISCLESTWPILRQKTVASAGDRFRELSALPPVVSAAVAERLIAGRLARAYAGAGFAPPYPTYPFTRAAVESAVGLRPRAILMRCQEFQEACLVEGRLRECGTLALATQRPVSSVQASALETAALDEVFARARAQASLVDFADEDAVGVMLAEICELYLRQLSLPETIDAEASPDPNPRNPSLHGRLAFIFHEENHRQQRYSFRCLAQESPVGFQSRLKAAITASGVEANMRWRRLVVLRASAPPSGPKTEQLVKEFLDMGGQLVAPAREDFATFAALLQLSRQAPAGFDAWLKMRRPLFSTYLMQTAGLAPPDFLPGERAGPAPVAAVAAPLTIVSAPQALALAPAPPMVAIAPPAPVYQSPPPVFAGPPAPIFDAAPTPPIAAPPIAIVAVAPTAPVRPSAPPPPPVYEAAPIAAPPDAAAPVAIIAGAPAAPVYETAPPVVVAPAAIAAVASAVPVHETAPPVVVAPAAIAAVAPPPPVAAPAPSQAPLVSAPAHIAALSALLTSAVRPPPSLPLRAPPRRPASDRDYIPIGRAFDRGAVLGPVSLLAELLPRHIAVLAGAGAGKSVLVSRVVEEAALIGIPSLVIDFNNDLARLGQPWPSRPVEFTDDDSRKARAYFEHVEVAVWAPSVSDGRPFWLPPLPDFAGLASSRDQDEREAAIEMALATLEPYLQGRGARAIKSRGVLVDVLRAFAFAGGGSLEDLVQLLYDLPEETSPVARAPEISREIAEQIIAAMAIDPLLHIGGSALDPAHLFESPTGKTRVSVINLSGLESDEARQAFVNQLQMALFGWIGRNPMATGCLFVLDQAHFYAPAGETPASKRSAMALMNQGRKYGLGMIFATPEPRGIDPDIVSGCATHVYGRLSSPASLGAVREFMSAAGGGADDLSHLRAGEFYFVTEGFIRPVKIRAPLCLTRRSPNPPTSEEVAELARARA